MTAASGLNVVHRTIGPFYACKYAGVDPDRPQDPDDLDDVDVVVWLLYEPEPPAPPTDEPWVVQGILYNRRRDQPQSPDEEDRSDRWIARVHGPGHHHHHPNPERHYRGRTENDAIKQLWLHLHTGSTGAHYNAAVANAQATFQPGSRCG